MAATALQPARAPANALRARFDAAMRHHGRQTARQAALPASPTMAEDLAAAEAVERSLGRLIATPAPDVLALGRKLHLLLDAAGASRALRASIAADVRQLSNRRARA